MEENALNADFKDPRFSPLDIEELPDPELFLRHLCEKAGLHGDCWQDPKTEIEEYEAIYFSAGAICHKL